MSWGTVSLTVRFGETIALDDVSLDIEPGVIHSVVGGDGAGKSTLLRLLAGLGIAHEGEVRIPSQERIGYVGAHGGVFGDLTVAENLEFVASAYRLKKWQARGHDLLERGRLQDFVDRLASQLSGGQRRKLAGSMALLPEPDLLVLDELTTGVDPVSRIELWRIVAGAAGAGTAVVAATTYLDEAARAGRVALLEEGRLLVAGTPDEVIEGIPGWVSDEETPTNRQKAWRYGRRWHQWHPSGDSTSPYQPTLEDAAIVYELDSMGDPQ